MGASLTRAARWTAVGYGTGSLSLTPLNELLLNDIITYVNTISSKYPQEASFVFKEPLEWTTHLEPSAFGSDYEVIENTVKSNEKDKDGHPLLLLSSSIIKVRSFGQISRLLQLANEKKILEARACLEANRDPEVKILGPAFATVEGEDRSSLRLLDTIKVDKSHNAETKMKILLLLNQLDVQLLNSSLQHITKEPRLTPRLVKREVSLLWRNCGEGENTVLKNIEYTEGHVFSNGCRAPPWRQVHGEICYLAVITHDTEPLFITCSTYGVFLNGGKPEAVHEINYERTSDIYKDLIALLKDKSPKFELNLSKQNIRFFQDPEPEQSTSATDGLHASESTDEVPEKSTLEKAKEVAWKRKSMSRKSIRPLAEGKNLGLLETHEETPKKDDI